MNRMITSVKVASGALAAVALIFSAAASARSSSTNGTAQVESGKVMVLRHLDARTGLESETLQLSKRVDFSDIDIGTKQGEAALDRRIAVAATSVCIRLGNFYPEYSAPGEMMERAACVERAIGNATQAVEPAVIAARKAEHH